MINRRSLRIKAFKNLYAFESCKGANYLMGLDILDKEFSPDLNSMEIVDKDELDRKKQLALEDFNLHFDRENTDKNYNPEVESEVQDALDYVEKQNKADFKRLSKDLLEEADRVTKDHLTIISLLEEMVFINKRLSDEKKSLANILGEKVQSNTNLFENKVAAKIKNSESYQKLKKSLIKLKKTMV